MTNHHPDRYDYLALVSEWSSTAMRGGLVGNAYPLLNLTTGEAVSEPREEFPNPGAVFLMNRGTLHTWDFVLVRPRTNDRYTNLTERDCYYLLPRQPELLSNPAQAANVAVILEHPTFDLSSTTRQILNPRHNVTPYFFVQKNQKYYGPLIRALTQLSSMEDVQRIDWRPIGDDGVIYEFTQDELLGQGLRIVEYSHPDPSLNRILSVPIQMAVGPVRQATSGRPRDALPVASAIDWYLLRCPGVEVSASQLSALKAAFRGEAHDPPTILAARLDRIEREMAANLAFLEQRDRFARHYVESEPGQRRISELIEQTVAKKATEIQSEVDRRQSQLAATRDELGKKRIEAESDHQQLLGELQNKRDALQSEISELKTAAEQLRESLSRGAQSFAAKMREQVPLFAALTSAWREPGTPAPHTDGVATATNVRRHVFLPIPPSTEVQPVGDEDRFVDTLHANLARQGLYFARDFVANIYTCLKAEPLNLIIGPPGYGKSMLVTALARVLGHRDALLRIAVRRPWAEDRYLLGSFDSFHNRYDPGATGLVPRMLQAEADWRKDRTGVYIILLDEFNLAAPEYYFSQMLQVLPSDDPVREVVLYDAASSGGDGFPHRVVLGPNLRFWGTINYDETTERLSPRTLDRTGMIFLGDADVKSTIDDDLPPMPGVAGKDLFEKFLRTPEQCPEEQWGMVSKVIDLLRRPDADLGPRVELSPRVQRAIKRYLANSAAVLDPRVAVDFVVQQRILPVVRGRGEDFLARINRVAQLLAETNLRRSAHHVEEALRRSEQQFGELDFLIY